MAEPVFTSALAGVAAVPGLSISAREISDRGMIDLRGDPKDDGFRAAVEGVLGVALPLAPRTSVSNGATVILWLSIDQWLVTCPRSRAPRLGAALNDALGPVHSLVVDLSDARAILRLEGEGVREVLMKGVPVDLTLPEFTPGTVRRLRFGEIAALIHIVGEAPDVIDLYVFRSYARFACDWIAATARAPAKLRLFGRQEI
jgi:sarcosine oxidase, subunit gamma